MHENTLREYAESSEYRKRLTAARAKNTPLDSLVSLSYDKERIVRLYASLNARLPHDRTREIILSWKAREEFKPWLDRLASRPDLTDELLELTECAKIISHPNYAEKKKLHIAKYGNPWERKFLAKNSNLSQKIQRILTTDVLPVRLALAYNTFISTETALILKDDSSSAVQRIIIRHPALAPYRKEMTERLASRKPSMTNGIVIAKYSEDTELLAQVYDSVDHDGVHYTALQNDKLDAERVYKACFSKNANVRKLAKMHHECTEDGLIVAALLD